MSFDNKANGILGRLENVRKTKKGWSANCPAHDDQHPSLSITENDDGRVLLHCHAGCTIDSICGAVGMQVSDLMPSPSVGDDKFERSRKSQTSTKTRTYKTAKAAVAALEREHGERSAHWEYHDHQGNPVGLIVRWDKPGGAKDIRPVSRNGAGWKIGGMPEPRPLYQLRDLAGADCVYVTEGEPATDAARSIGLMATTSPHGSKSADKADWMPLAGKGVAILPDNDEAGRKYADTVAAILMKLGCTVKIVELPGLPDGGDIVDWIDGHGDAAEPEELRRQVESQTERTQPIQISAIPRERDRARIEFRPIPASQLGDGEQVDWIWHGYLARAFVTLLVGLWKGGKTTLVAFLLKALEAGGDLAGTVQPAKTIVITEEGSGLWARRRDDVGFGDKVCFDIRPFKCRPTQRDWQQYIELVAQSVERGEYDLVIVDTWSAVNPCHDENDAAGMMAALSPLHQIADAGAAILLIHHPKKGDANEGQASRGSGALPGFVDTIIELRRFNAQQADDRRRKLRGHSRFEETPAEVVIELGSDGYKLVGSTGDANRDDRQQVIAEILTDTEWRTVDEIRDAWPDGTIPKPGKRTIQLDLNQGYEAGRWVREGKGTKGDAYRYKFDSRTPPLLSAHNESNDDEWGEV